jgi:hypothetical protein
MLILSDNFQYCFLCGQQITFNAPAAVFVDNVSTFKANLIIFPRKINRKLPSYRICHMLKNAVSQLPPDI